MQVIERIKILRLMNKDKKYMWALTLSTGVRD